MVLRDLFTEWKSGNGIFDLITNPPWESEMDSTSLNIDYFGNHSGAKFASPLVSQLLVDGSLTSQAKQTLATIIEKKYKSNWSRLWLTNTVNYIPDHNYDMNETRTRETKGTESQSITDNGSESNDSKNTQNLTNTVTHGKTQDVQTGKYAFNSTAEEPVEHVATSDGGETVEKNTGTDSVESSKTMKNERSVDGSDSETETETIKRTGNIGVTSSQQLIEEERQLWMWNYFEQVFSDVDKVLTIPFYDACQV